jgi:Tfp pilus assembly protein PilN
MKAVNLLPSDQRGASAKTPSVPVASQPGGAGAFAVLGALALMVVAVAGYVLTTNTIKERQATLDGLAAREQAAQAKVGNLKPYADFAQLAATRVATVMDLAGRRFDWENALRDLSRAIPSNVTLTSLDGSVGTEGGGTGGSSLRGAINAPAITITGCTDGQRDVAALMSRLRTVDGVTRVSLAKSVKQDVDPVTTDPGGGPTVAVTGGGAECGAGSPPEFEMVMFFERDADASAAPTGPAGKASTAATTAASSTTGTTTATGDSSTTTSTQGATDR